MQISLHLTLKYFDCKFYVFGVELEHDCSFNFFLSLIQYDFCQKFWVSILQWKASVSSHSVVSFNISIYSLNIVQFVVRMRSNKNHKMRHSRKRRLWVEGFSLNTWIFKIFAHTGYCFYFLTELAKFPDNLINLGWFSHVLGHHIFQPYV